MIYGYYFDKDNVLAVRLLTVSSIACLLLGLAEIGAGSATFSFHDQHAYGAWYAGIACAIAACYSLITVFTSGSGASPSMTTGTSAVAVVVSLIGTIIDGLGYGFINSLMACTNSAVPSTSSGSSGYFTASIACQLDYDCDCACVKEVLADDPTCYLFTRGFSGDTSCSPILDDYPGLIHASYSLALCCLAVSAVSTLLLSTLVKKTTDLNLTFNPAGEPGSTSQPQQATPVYATKQ